MSKFTTPQYLGIGFGYRHHYHNNFMNDRHSIQWFEFIAEDYMIDGGKQINQLHEISHKYPLAMHSVGLNIGSFEPFCQTYLAEYEKVLNRFNPLWISDHLSWSNYNGIYTHDLIPIAYNEKNLKNIISKINYLQAKLNRQILLENPSAYLKFKSSDITEYDFINEVVQKTGCGILLDINNVYVSCFNLKESAIEYLDNINHSSVYQIHLAGHKCLTSHKIDDHAHQISNDVISLYNYFINKSGKINTMIERDSNFPPFAEMEEEILLIKQFLAEDQKNYMKTLQEELNH